MYGTAQTNFIDGAEIEGDFFSYCDNLIDERDDLGIPMLLID